MDRHRLIPGHGAVAAVGHQACRVGGKAAQKALEDEIGGRVADDRVVGLALVLDGEEFGLSALGGELFADVLDFTVSG